MESKLEDVRPSELFIVGYDGVALPEALADRYSRGDYAGLIFFARNFQNLTDVRQIAMQLDEISALYGAQCASPELARLAPILSIDHEGGRVQRIKKPLTVFPPMARLAEQPLAATEEAGRIMARELSAIGLNINYAPVLDIQSNPENPVIGDRAFGTTAESATERALTFLRGLEASGTVRGCGKHFPGHGDTATDSHHTLPVVKHDADRLRAVELAPFAAAVRAGIGMIMTAHVVYPAIDSRPATLSRKWLNDILRGELGFDGVILSDDLDMRALGPEHLRTLIGTDDEGQVVVESLLAGCDAFLLCRDAARQARAEAALTEAAKNRSDVRARLHEAAARLRRFRATLHRPQIDRPFVETLSAPAAS